MGNVILLDTHPLSKVTHPKIEPKVSKWLQSLHNTETAIRVPEIADYELRRELLNITMSVKHISLGLVAIAIHLLILYCFGNLFHAEAQRRRELQS